MHVNAIRTLSCSYFFRYILTFAIMGVCAQCMAMVDKEKNKDVTVDLGDQQNNTGFDPVDNVNAPVVRARGMTLTWDKPSNPEYSGVVIDVMPQIPVAVPSITITGSEVTTAMIEGLAFNTDYSFTITAKYNEDLAEPIVFSKRSSAGPSVTGLTASTNGDQVIVSWMTPTLGFDHYSGVTITVISANGVARQPVEVIADSQSDNTQVITDLDYATNYTITVVTNHQELGISNAVATTIMTVATPIPFSAISAGSSFSCALLVGHAYCWGLGTQDRLGNGLALSQNQPVLVEVGVDNPLGNVTAIDTGFSHTCAIAAGNTYCWGQGTNGQIGNGEGANQSRPVVVETAADTPLANVTEISLGNAHTCAISDGNAYCWGLGTLGRLGNGAFDRQNRPVIVETAENTPLANVSAIAVGSAHSCAIADGHAHCWGRGTSGQLGNGLQEDQNRPVVVETAANTPLENVTDISVGNVHTCAISEGTAYCWGSGVNGRLGNGRLGRQERPVVVGTATGVALTNVTAIASGGLHSCALAAGNAYCWGKGEFGRLGNGTVDGKRNATLVSKKPGISLANVNQISAGAKHTCALANDEAYCWGDDEDGELGDGMANDSSFVSRPVRVIRPDF